MHKLVHSGPSHAGLCVSEVEVCHAWKVFRLISHCLQEVAVHYMPQQGMLYTSVCTVFIKSTPLSLRARLHESGFGSKRTEIDPFWVVVYTNPAKTST